MRSGLHNKFCVILVMACFGPPALVSVLGTIHYVDRTNFGLLDNLLLISPQVAAYLVLAVGALLSAQLLWPGATRTAKLTWAMVCIFLSLNALMLELNGLAYKLTTGANDFDYSLVFHSIRNMDDLWPVFSSVINPALVAVLAALGALYIVALIWISVRSVTEGPVHPRLVHLGGGALLVAAVACAIGIYGHTFPGRPGRLTISAAPPPIALSAVMRSFAKVHALSTDQDTAPIRSQFPTDTGLKLPGEKKALPNIVLIIGESTGYKHTLGLDMEETHTPFLKTLAASGTEFVNTYSYIPHTSKSIVSILCSIEPFFNLPVIAGKLKGGLPVRCLPKLLGDVGYRSVYLSTVTGEFEYRKRFVENAGFDVSYMEDEIASPEYEKNNYFGYEEDALLPHTAKVFADTSGEPLFMTILTLTPHHPYIPPSHFEAKQLSDDEEKNGYLNALRYQDVFLSKLYQQVEEAGLKDNTVFVFVGDHGEAFGEHGLKQHDAVPFFETLRVPFVIVGAGIEAGLRVTKNVSLLDVLPTLVDISGAEPTGNFDAYAGTSVFSRPADQPVFSYCYREKYCASMVQGRWKYVHYFGYAPNLFFDLETDQLELSPLAVEGNETAERMEKELIAYVDAVEAYQRAFLSQSSWWNVNTSNPPPATPAN